MPHISGRPDIHAGYFHDAKDTSKTATAVRASYSPSLSDQITNRFARMNMPAVAGFVNGLRSLRLTHQKLGVERRLKKKRASFDAFEEGAGRSGEELHAAGQPLRALQFEQSRLDHKLQIGEAALEGGMGEKTRGLSTMLRRNLAESGYQELKGLGAAQPAQADSAYLVSSADGHRIKVNSERPPLLARMIANSVSEGYDRGSSGAGRAALSTMQHALVGVYSAQQSIKGMATRKLAENSFLDQGARARMNVRAARTSQKIDQLQAAFGGNVRLNDEFRSVVGKQAKAADSLKPSDDSPYEERQGPPGVKPPQTRLWERKVNAYYQGPAAGEGDAAPAAPPRAGTIARFALGVANLRNTVAQRHHAWRKKVNDSRALDSSTEADRDRFAQRSTYHDSAAASRQHAAKVRSSALQGKLIDTLKDRSTRDLLDQAAPRIEDI